MTRVKLPGLSIYLFPSQYFMKLEWISCYIRLLSNPPNSMDFLSHSHFLVSIGGQIAFKGINGSYDNSIPYKRLDTTAKDHNWMTQGIFPPLFVFYLFFIFYLQSKKKCELNEGLGKAAKSEWDLYVKIILVYMCVL